ncbi:hypothetical protein AALP_AA1G169600 [Arabis alpina]|uniref:Sulfhydryl oxidase n=1 Tax=Arabis alpina TaxID=50452 RepID=A0A087HNR2_ARAAL|nr:hypothetical protein AALP_AA1G169600 [Arabis alpina]
MSLLHLFLFVGLVSLEAAAASFSPGSRSILRDIGGNIADQKDNAVELNATNFDSVFQETPAKSAILEFFAHWCPACRNYKPHYEKVARLFNGAEAVHPGQVLMTRVDCAVKMNVKLCDKFSINHYPMLFWGPPKKFVGGSWKPKQEKSEISVVDEWRTADLLLTWINKQLGSSYGLDDQKSGNEPLLPNISDHEQISQAVYDIEEATEEAFDIILAHKAIKSSETGVSLIRFLQLLVAHHPSRKCRKGSAEILVNFGDLCPLGECSYDQESGAKDTLRNFHICGKDVPRGYYMFCRGSKNETRGFSCGLWVLMHSLSVRIEDGESQFAFTTICDFINNFFMCDDCRRHFHDMCLSVKTPFKKARDIVLWLWSTHNKVNERLKKDEDSLGTGDPKFPKMIWPPKQLCPSCYLSSTQKNIDWDHDEVYKFLKNYYGPKLVSSYKKSDGSASKEEVVTATEEMAVPTNALVVPVGAALAIALASCAFGALACYWRTQQKNRKYYHNPHYLKRYNSSYMVMNTFSNTESEREKER